MIYLSAQERRGVSEIAGKHNIEGNPTELVKFAVDAVIRGGAPESAYEVADAAGIEFICGDNVWLKRQEEEVAQATFDAEQAREIVSQAINDDIWEEVPKDDDEAISIAENLVNMARDAWNDNVRGAEVEAILRLADEDWSPDAESDEADSDEDEGESNGDGDPEDKSDEPSDDALAETEPWDGYDSEQVSEIRDGIDAAIAEWDPDDVDKLLDNIWAYESAHKDRSRILKHIEQIGQDKDEETDEGEESPSEEAGEEASGEAEDEPKRPSRTQASPRGRKAVQDRSRKSDPDAEDQSIGEIAKKVGERQRAKASKAAEVDEDSEPYSATEDIETSDEEYQELISVAEDQLKRERLHVPGPIEEDPPELPWDWTKITDQQLQKLYGSFSAYAYRTAYLAAREERRGMLCRNAADEIHREMLDATDKYDERDRQKSVTILDAEIENLQQVSKWRRRQRKHETFAANYKRQRDSYSDVCERLSRLETMKSGEYERSQRSDNIRKAPPKRRP